MDCERTPWAHRGALRRIERDALCRRARRRAVALTALAIGGVVAAAAVIGSVVVLGVLAVAMLLRACL